MAIRTFQPGDETAQVSIYNEAAAALPKFKPATLDEIRRRCYAPDFDPGTRFFAIVDGQPVGYVSFHTNGRVSYPWCRKGHEDQAGPLFERMLQVMQERGLRRAFAAYRGDWPTVHEFFRARDFRLTREMVNYWLDPTDMPTPSARRSYPVTPVAPPDIPAIFALAPEALRVSSPAALEKHLLCNPYFPASSVFALRDRSDSTIVAAAVLVLDPAYTDPRQVDAAMPCFRLGAFGTEGMQTKRINGLLSFVARNEPEFKPMALDLIAHAVFRLHRSEGIALGAQVPSDVPHLAAFYQHHFRRQGSFPIWERVG
jgi:hypothetical protein